MAQSLQQSDDGPASGLRRLRLLVLGASGGVGSRLLEQAVARGYQITAQTRSQGKIAETPSIRVIVGSPSDEAFLKRHMAGHAAVIVCTGVNSIGRTTLFSDTIRAVVAAMQDAGVSRLIAITGIGAGETRGHGGWFYNHVIYPLFTRNRYADKDRQEAIIERSGLNWTIVRPASFRTKAGAGPWTVCTQIPPDLQLTSITRDEVAAFILDTLESDGFIHEKPFIGHV